MKSVPKKDAKAISAEDSEDSLVLASVFIAFVIAVPLTVLRQQLAPEFAREHLFPLCLLVSYIGVKKYRQRTKLSETVFTEKTRDKWLKNRKTGFVKFTALNSIRWAGLMSLFIAVGLLCTDYSTGRPFYFLNKIEELVRLFVYFFALGVLISVLLWLDNMDSEAEWQRKRAEK